METKHIFAGNQRITSVMTLSGTTNYFYYQTDHLGSTGYLTDKNGTLAEHIEYTPWGESWFSNPGTPVLDYKFTGKEQDNTGFYYFGARYYDPQTSLWISTDPGFTEFETDYLMQSLNLNSYKYGNLDPIIFQDLDGLYDYKNNIIAKGDTFWNIAKNDPSKDTTTKEWQDFNSGKNPYKLKPGDTLKRPEHLQQAPKISAVAKAASFVLAGAAMLASGSDVDPFTHEAYNEGESQNKKMNAAMFLAQLAIGEIANPIMPKIRFNGNGTEKTFIAIEDSSGNALIHYGAPGKYGPHIAIGNTHFYQSYIYENGTSYSYGQWVAKTIKGWFK
jgi:RHS repeat-associated protein